MTPRVCWKLKNTVTAEWVKRHLEDRKVRVLDARTRKSFLRAHIPGAVNADFFHYFIPGTDKKGLKQFNAELALMLGKLGLQGGERTVVYETGFGMRAARIAWMLQYAGMNNVSLLEGGFSAWQEAQYPIQLGPSRLHPKTFRLEPNDAILATAGSIISGSNRTRILLDVRSRGEFEGSENRDCCPRPGRIPGAVWLEWTLFLENSSGFLHGRSMMSQLRKAGIDPRKEIITYCHRGARAASAYYALKALGFPKVRNYVGSWHEWSSKTRLPVETGPRLKR